MSKRRKDRRSMMKAFIVTGSSRGLGLEICRQLIKPNHMIFSISRTENETLHATAAEQKCPVYFMKYDLQNVEGIPDFMMEILKQVDHSELESITLINNAGQVTPLGAIA